MVRYGRDELVKEILEMMEVFDPQSLPEEDLILFHKLLQPSVDMWNDAEDEYQSMVDDMGDGVQEYNYNRYITNFHERQFLKAVEEDRSRGVKTFRHYIPKEVMAKIHRGYIEHKTNSKLNYNYDESYIEVSF